jgi:RimJ/RimL family protein N-acetyltransferase
VRASSGASSAIDTERLRLLPVTAAFLRASLAGACETAEQLLGARLPAQWTEVAEVLRVRLGQLEHAPELAPWLTRAVVLRAEARVVGIAGFHGPPGGAWLREVAPEGVEFGYTIFPPDRRRGYATEAGAGLMRWASAEHGVRCFVLSIGPENHASAALARKLGFTKVAEWVHEQRGLEHVYRRVLGPRAALGA